MVGMGALGLRDRHGVILRCSGASHCCTGITWGRRGHFPWKDWGGAFCWLLWLTASQSSASGPRSSPTPGARGLGP